MNNKNQNLMDILKANDYDLAEEDAAGFSPHLSELSRPVIKRVRALKKLQLESLQVETQFYQKVYELEKQFQPLFDAVNAKRREIVAGEHEPTDEEADTPLLHGVTQETLEVF
uniref:Nucleosome assembly protein n=2 Tax=Meloidogyne javanica TaxID=6303 RepID=A0A915M6E9_MELJA